MITQRHKIQTMISQLLTLFAAASCAGVTQRDQGLPRGLVFIVDPAPGQPKLDQGERHKNHKEQPGQRTRIPHLEVKETLIVNLDYPEEQRIHWTCRGLGIIGAA